MSIKATTAVWTSGLDDLDVESSRRDLQLGLLLFALADFHTEQGCFVGQKTLAKRLHVSPRTVMRQIKRARARGLLWTEQRASFVRTNVYHLICLEGPPDGVTPIPNDGTIHGDNQGDQMCQSREADVTTPEADVTTLDRKGVGNRRLKQKPITEAVEPLRGPSSSSTSPDEPREVKARRVIEAARDKLPGHSAEHGMMNTLLKRLDNVPADPEEQELFFAKLREDYSYWAEGVL